MCGFVRAYTYGTYSSMCAFVSVIFSDCVPRNLIHTSLFKCQQIFTNLFSINVIKNRKIIRDITKKYIKQLIIYISWHLNKLVYI